MTRMSPALAAQIDAEREERRRRPLLSEGAVFGGLDGAGGASGGDNSDGGSPHDGPIVDGGAIFIGIVEHVWSDTFKNGFVETAYRFEGAGFVTETPAQGELTVFSFAPDGVTLYLSEPTYTDVQVAAELASVSAFETSSAFVRASNTDPVAFDGLRSDVDAASWALNVVAGGVPTPIAAGVAPANVGDVVGVKWFGGTATAYLNGGVLGTGPEGTTVPGKAGLFSNAAPGLFSRLTIQVATAGSIPT